MTTDDRRVAEALAEIERLKAELVALRECYELEVEVKIERLKEALAERDALAEQLNSVTSMAERFGQERDALRADAERVRGLLRDASHAATWGDAQALIDAAMTAIDTARKCGEGTFRCTCNSYPHLPTCGQDAARKG